jgi:Right handed beta helix region
VGGELRDFGGRGRAAAVVAVMLVVGAACVPPHRDSPIDPVVGALDPASRLLGCDHAAQRLVVAGPTHLDPSCTYTGGVDISTSGATLDCRGARIEAGPGAAGPGILIDTPATAALADVTVRNCIVKGFSNNLRVRRSGFKDLVEGAEYDAATSGILIERSHFYDSAASGVFVDGFVTGVTLRDVEVSGSGSVGVYLEAGSKDNVVEDSTIHHNGFGAVTPEGVPIVVAGTELRYESTGREGIAIDGSRDNVVRDNWISYNSAGAIFLYKNCGEDATTKPDSHWVRRYGATGNVISGNLVSTEKNGVWIGSRAAENQVFMDCSDPAYIDEPLRRVFLDPASDNTVTANSFLYVSYGVRVEDDRTTVTDNFFSSSTAGDRAVLVGTKERTAVLDRPVTGTVIAGNRADIPGNATPYTWIWDHTATTFSDNLSNGTPAPLTEGTQPPINPFLFAIRVWAP